MGKSSAVRGVLVVVVVPLALQVAWLAMSSYGRRNVHAFAVRFGFSDTFPGLPPDKIEAAMTSSAMTSVPPLKKIRLVKDLAELASDWETPAIIRDYNPQCLDELTAHPSDDVVRMFHSKVKGFGSALRQGHSYTRTFTDHSTSKLLAQEVDMTDSFAAFASFLTPAQSKQTSGSLAAERVFVRDTNFISNFSQPLISTGIHAASLVKSWALQCAGEKRWVILDAAANAVVETISTPAIVPMNWDFAKVHQYAYVGTVGAGDLLYFPPSWLHIVNTRPGFNVMLNFRETAIGQSFIHSPLMSAATILMRLVDQVGERFVDVPGNKAAFEQQYNPLQPRNRLDELLIQYSSNVPELDDKILMRIFDDLGPRV